MTVESQGDAVLYLEFAGCSLNEKPGSNWVQDAGGLPDYICRIARAVKRSGHPTGEAIQIAVGQVRNWAHGHGGKVTPKTRAKAAEAAAAWEALKAKSKAATAAKHMVKASSSEYVSFCAELFSVDDVTAAYQNSDVAASMFAGPNAGPRPGDPDQSSRIVQVWSQFLIVTGDLDNDADLDYYKVPFNVSSSDSDQVDFGTPVEVKQAWVDDAGNSVGVSDDDLDGSDLSDDDMQALLDLANSWEGPASATDRLAFIAERETPVTAVQRIVEKYQRPASEIVSLAAGDGRVKGHYQHYKGKLVFVKEHAGRAGHRLNNTELAHALKDGKAEFHSFPTALQHVTLGATIAPRGQVHEHGAAFGHIDALREHAERVADKKPLLATQVKSVEKSKSGTVAPGKYHVKNGTRVGSAHMVVHPDGKGTYVNSRGEEKPLTPAQVARNHAAGMNHNPGTSTPTPDDLKDKSAEKSAANLGPGEHISHPAGTITNVTRSTKPGASRYEFKPNDGSSPTVHSSLVMAKRDADKHRQVTLARSAENHAQGLPAMPATQGFAAHAQPWVAKLKSPEEKSYLTARAKQVEAGTPRPSGMSAQHGVAPVRVAKLESALAHIHRSHELKNGS